MGRSVVRRPKKESCLQMSYYHSKQPLASGETALPKRGGTDDGLSVWVPLGAPLNEYRACRGLKDNEIERLITLGVPPAALGGSYHEGEFAIAADLVVFDGDHFEFARYCDGEPTASFIFLVRNEHGDLADLAAWVPATGQLVTWLGHVAMLGEQNTLAPRIGDPLAVHETPLEWLKASRDGVVLIHELIARPILQAAAPLATGTIAHGLRLRHQLAMQAPRILVRAA